MRSAPSGRLLALLRDLRARLVRSVRLLLILVRRILLLSLVFGLRRLVAHMYRPRLKVKCSAEARRNRPTAVAGVYGMLHDEKDRPCRSSSSPRRVKIP